MRITCYCRIEVWFVSTSLNLGHILIELLTHRVFEIWLLLVFFISILVNILHFLLFHSSSNSWLSLFIEIGFALIK